MHVLSMRSRFASLSSFGGIAWDFVEAPSQIFENWLYEPVVLKQIGRHYKTGAPMPDELINRIIAAKNVNGAAYVGRQLHYAVWDMAIHEFKSHEEAQAVDPTALYNNIRLDITKLKGEEAFGGNR